MVNGEQGVNQIPSIHPIVSDRFPVVKDPEGKPGLVQWEANWSYAGWMPKPPQLTLLWSPPEEGAPHGFWFSFLHHNKPQHMSVLQMRPQSFYISSPSCNLSWIRHQNTWTALLEADQPLNRTSADWETESALLKSNYNAEWRCLLVLWGFF